MGGEALTPPTAPAGAPVPLQLHRAGVNCVLFLCLQVVVQRGLAPRARELLADSSALEEAVLEEQRRLGLGECRVQLGVRALWGPSPSGHVGRHRVSQGRGCPLGEFSPLLSKSVPGSSAMARHPPWLCDRPPGRGRPWGRGRGDRLTVFLLSWLGAVCVPGRRGGAGGEQGVGCALCRWHLRALVAVSNGSAFLSLHYFTCKMGIIALAVGPGGCPKTWVPVPPPELRALVSRCLHLTVCV